MTQDTFKYVFVNTRFEGCHRWPEAPSEVGFLKDLHRHEFHVKLSIKVTHNDRDIEFIMLKRWLDDYINTSIDFMPDTKSCEDMASKIIEGACLKWGDTRDMICTVSEDGENGSELTYGAIPF